MNGYELMDILTSILKNVISSIAFVIIGWFWANKKHIYIGYQSIILRKKEIRISISYLFQININGKYLLVKGNRINQYQPVGGVYKVFPSFENIKNKYDIKDDKHFPIDVISKSDLRIRINGRYLLGLLRWFDTRKNREIDVHREFYEEMINTGILNMKSLTEFNPEYYKTLNTKVKYSEHFDCKELLLYEVYKIKLTKEEIELVKKYVNENSEKAILCTEDNILKKCITINGISTQIGEHAQYIL